jgi:hypothetical protein
MPEYARFRALLETDDYATYVDPLRHSVSIALTPDEGVTRQPIEAPSSAGAVQEIDLTHMTTMTLFMIEHGDANGDAVVVTWVDSTATYAACTAIISAGGCPLVIPDVDPATNPTIISSTTTAQRMLVSYTGT